MVVRMALAMAMRVKVHQQILPLTFPMRVLFRNARSRISLHLEAHHLDTTLEHLI